MWVARGPPRILKRQADAIVKFSKDGYWKVEVTPSLVQLSCLQYKEESFTPQAIERHGYPIDVAFLPNHSASRLIVLTSTTIEMYCYLYDTNDGISIKQLEIIAFGKVGEEEGRCLCVNEDNIFIGTTKARVMIFRWAIMGKGGRVISLNESLQEHIPVLNERGLYCTVMSCSSSFILTSRVILGKDIIQPNKSSESLAVCLSNGKTILLSFNSESFHLEDVVCIDRLDKSTTCALDNVASTLAVGTSFSSVIFFRLHHKKKIELRTASKTFQSIEAEEMMPSLSLQLWGYQPEDLGSVSCLAFTPDCRAIAIGYAYRGLSVFSTDGCKLMSTLPQQGGSVKNKDEVARSGVQSLQWSREGSALIVIPASETNILSTKPTPPLFCEVELEIFKDLDGLCLSLTGEPNQLGAWVRIEQPFVKRASNGEVGPAESTQKIKGGEFLLAINGNDVWNMSFEAIVSQIKSIPVGSIVRLTFLVPSLDEIFPLASDALCRPEFIETHKLEIAEDVLSWEYALKMQALYGNCNQDAPPLVEYESRVKFDYWLALQGSPRQLIIHRYMKLYLSQFPGLNPVQALQFLHPLPTPPSSSKNELLHSSFVTLDFARSVLPLDRSDLHLLESQSVSMVTPRSSNDPCGVLSSVTISVPSSYSQLNQPMRLMAVSSCDTRIAVAGSRGFTTFNKRTSKWTVFGSVPEEQSFEVVAMTWWKDVVLAALVQSEDSMYIDIYPRNHLDLDARIAHVPVAQNCYAITLDDHAIYCLSETKISIFRITTSGSIEAENLSFSIHLDRTEPLPLCNSILGRVRCFSIVPRLQRKVSAEVQSNSWFGDVWTLFSDSSSGFTLPRFLMLDQVNSAYMWDPETKIQNLIASDITHISHWNTPEDWPVACSHLFGFYGRQGYQIWWPLLDNVIYSSPIDKNNALQFLQTHDPARAKSIASTLPKSLTWDAYLGLIAEYGVHLESGSLYDSTSMLVDPLLRFNPEVNILGIHSSFGVLIGAFQDSYMGIYDLSCRVQPFVHTTICFLLLHHQTEMAKVVLDSIRQHCALTTLTQELVLVAILDMCYQKQWDIQVLERALTLIKDPDNELETYCEIVANVARKVEPNRLPLLFPLAGDPSQLLQLCRQRNEVRTAANFLLCLDESNTNEASVVRQRTNSYAQFQSRSALAFELLVDCCEKDQLHLALQVVRVARAWEPEHYKTGSQQYDRYIDEQVGKYAFQMLVQHRFDKVVWLLTQVEANLPILHGEELGINDKNSPQIQTRLLALLNDSQMRILHEAVVLAHYDHWAALIKNVRDQSSRKV